MRVNWEVCLNVVLFVLGGALGGLVGFVAGGIGGNLQAYHNRFREEQAALAAVVEGDPAFAGVRVEPYSAGGADLSGTVETEEDLSRLRAAFVNAIGETRAREHFLVEVNPGVRADTDAAP